MIRRLFSPIDVVRTAVLVMLVAAGCLLASSADAQVFRNFTPRFTTNTTGDITLVGNTVMSCPSGGGCTNARNGGGGNRNRAKSDARGGSGTTAHAP